MIYVCSCGIGKNLDISRCAVDAGEIGCVLDLSGLTIDENDVPLIISILKSNCPHLICLDLSHCYLPKRFGSTIDDAIEENKHIDRWIFDECVENGRAPLNLRCVYAVLRPKTNLKHISVVGCEMNHIHGCDRKSVCSCRCDCSV